MDLSFVQPRVCHPEPEAVKVVDMLGQTNPGNGTMIVAVLQYPAYLPSFDETAERCRAVVPFFETEVSGLIDKTWGMNEELGLMCSVYHFEDRSSAEAYFATEAFREFVKTTLQDQVEMELFDVAAVAYQRSLRLPPGS